MMKEKKDQFELIDTHTHLFLEHFNEDLEEVISRAKREGIIFTLLPNIDSTSHEKMMQVCNHYPGYCLPMAGLHPTSVKGDYIPELDFVEKCLNNNTYFGIGESGIDLYWDKTFRKEQEAVFIKHIEYAKQYNLPLVIHARESLKEIFSVMDKHVDNRLSGVFHSFTGTIDDAQRIIDYGFKMGLGGILTFKNSGLDKVMQHVDLSHIVLETDSPYLAPVPYRGKRNESAYLIEIAKKLSAIHSKTIEDIADITTRNAKNLFNLV